MRLTKEHFNAGSPYSCWLKEQLCGELEDDETRNAIMSIKKFDDLPDKWKRVAVKIIRTKLDENFKG